MTTVLRVPYFVVTATAGKWDSASDELDGDWRRLAQASTTDFSAPVAAAVEAFREPWIAEIKAIAERASGYSDDLAALNYSMQTTDHAQAEKLRRLLPFDYRDAPILDV